MPPQPATRAASPPAGKKIMGLPRTTFFIIAGVGVAAIIGVIIVKRRQAASAAAATTGTPSTGTCPDGSAPDANGNCPQSGDIAGELATLQTEIGDLQAGQGGGSSGGSAGTVAGSTGTPTTPAAPAGGTGTPGGTSPAAPSTPGQAKSWQFPMPQGLKTTRVSSHGCTLSWNAVTGPSGQKPSGYTVRTRGGGVDYQHVSAGTSTGEYGPGGANLKPGTSYTSEVWANGGPVAPPHASVSWQTLKAGG